ncbi:MAG: ice-binding family protein [Candidatus Parcubacteria bacterium]|nr:ice-binding family protein [Candidatus Parcubacteria bacterium]
MKLSYKVSLAVLSAAAFLGPIFAHAATSPSLGAAAGYSLYGDAGVTNTGAGTHVWGNVGDNSLGHPGLLGTQVDGTIDAGAGVAGAAGTAYGALDAQGATGALDLAGTHTVTPGVYTVGATTLNGTLTLDGAGVYIFRSDSSITTSGAGTMNLINGATACNVFWQIPTSMSIGTGTHVEGTIIAQTGAITLATGATLVGRALAHTQVTLDSNQITEPTCAAAPPAPVYGCMDSTATNYNSSATSQTGVTCTYPVVTTATTTTTVVNPVVTTPTITTTTVVTPTLPNTGLPPRGTSTTSDAAMVTGILMAVLASLAVIQKKRKI